MVPVAVNMKIMDSLLVPPRLSLIHRAVLEIVVVQGQGNTPSVSAPRGSYFVHRKPHIAPDSGICLCPSKLWEQAISHFIWERWWNGPHAKRVSRHSRSPLRLTPSLLVLPCPVRSVLPHQFSHSSCHYPSHQWFTAS
jgi:hypothetical protein